MTHSYEITFRRPLRWLYEPLLGEWLQSELEAELDRLQRLLERDAGDHVTVPETDLET